MYVYAYAHDFVFVSMYAVPESTRNCLYQSMLDDGIDSKYLDIIRQIATGMCVLALILPVLPSELVKCCGCPNSEHILVKCIMYNYKQIHYNEYRVY